MKFTTIFLIVSLFFISCKNEEIYTNAEGEAEAVVGSKIKSDPETRVDELIKLEGLFIELQAVGGESTGHGIKLDNGKIIEIELEDNNFIDLFEEDLKVSLEGTFKVYEGVEISKRNVLVVSELKIYDVEIEPLDENSEQYFEIPGYFIQMAGIEHTGYGIKVEDDSIVELDLTTNQFRDEFIDDLRVKVGGYFKVIEGVEIKEREVFVVTKFKVLD